MQPEFDAQLITFTAKFEPDPPGTPATPRPPGRPRPTEAELAGAGEPVLHSFDCESEPLPADAGDAEFARALAERVLERVRTRPAGLSAEQLAALIQQFLARRSA